MTDLGISPPHFLRLDFVARTVPFRSIRLTYEAGEGEVLSKIVTCLILALGSSCASAPRMYVTPSRAASVGSSVVEEETAPLSDSNRFWKFGVSVAGDFSSRSVLGVVVKRAKLDIKGQSSGISDSAFSTGELIYEFRGVDAGYAFDALYVDAYIGSAELTQDRVGPDADSSDGVMLGVNVSRVLYHWDSISLGGKVGIGGGLAELDNATLGATEIRWMHSDIRTGLSVEPSNDAYLAVTPFGGVGFHFMDGVQIQAQGREFQLDGDGPYFFVGASLDWSPRPDFIFGAEVELTVGELESIRFSLVSSF
jgi:hypothetical protein